MRCTGACSRSQAGPELALTWQNLLDAQARASRRKNSKLEPRGAKTAKSRRFATPRRSKKKNRASKIICTAVNRSGRHFTSGRSVIAKQDQTERAVTSDVQHLFRGTGGPGRSQEVKEKSPLARIRELYCLIPEHGEELRRTIWQTQSRGGTRLCSAIWRVSANTGRGRGSAEVLASSTGGSDAVGQRQARMRLGCRGRRRRRARIIGCGCRVGRCSSRWPLPRSLAVS